MVGNCEKKLKTEVQDLIELKKKREKNVDEDCGEKNKMRLTSKKTEKEEETSKRLSLFSLLKTESPKKHDIREI